jgi:hypothetical protein
MLAEADPVGVGIFLPRSGLYSRYVMYNKPIDQEYVCLPLVRYGGSRDGNIATWIRSEPGLLDNVGDLQALRYSVQST